MGVERVEDPSRVQGSALSAGVQRQSLWWGQGAKLLASPSDVIIHVRQIADGLHVVSDVRVAVDGVLLMTLDATAKLSISIGL